MTTPSLSPHAANFWLEEARAAPERVAEETPMSWKPGGCHCGAVRFTVFAPDEIEALECNCSICRLTSYLHLIVPKERFRLQSGEDRLNTYCFNTGTAQHLFCKICGIKSFYVPRSHPGRYSVNVRCLDEGSYRSLRIMPFDGKQWEEAITTLNVQSFGRTA